MEVLMTNDVKLDVQEIQYDEKLLQEINQLSNTELLNVNKSITQLAYQLRALLGKSQVIMQSLSNCIEDKNQKKNALYVINNFNKEINEVMEVISD
jgi:hypothetical protein